jgi:hypothetical protein
MLIFLLPCCAHLVPNALNAHQAQRLNRRELVDVTGVSPQMTGPLGKLTDLSRFACVRAILDASRSTIRYAIRDRLSQDVGSDCLQFVMLAVILRLCSPIRSSVQTVMQNTNLCGWKPHQNPQLNTSSLA